MPSLETGAANYKARTSRETAREIYVERCMGIIKRLIRIRKASVGLCTCTVAASRIDFSAFLEIRSHQLIKDNSKNGS